MEPLLQNLRQKNRIAVAKNHIIHSSPFFDPSVQRKIDSGGMCQNYPPPNGKVLLDDGRKMEFFLISRNILRPPPCAASVQSNQPAVRTAIGYSNYVDLLPTGACIQRLLSAKGF